MHLRLLQAAGRAILAVGARASAARRPGARSPDVLWAMTATGGVLWCCAVIPRHAFWDAERSHRQRRSGPGLVGRAYPKDRRGLEPSARDKLGSGQRSTLHACRPRVVWKKGPQWSTRTSRR